MNETEPHLTPEEKPQHLAHEKVVAELAINESSAESREHMEKLKHTLDYIIECSENLGIKGKVYVFGGLLHDTLQIELPKRNHKDVDIMVQGVEEGHKLLQVLTDQQKFKHTTSGKLAEFSGQDLTSTVSEYGSIDLRWAAKQTRNGVDVWDLQIPEDIKAHVLEGKHFAIPESAFSQAEITIGQKSIKYIYPEYSFLTISASPDNHRRFDKAVLRKIVDNKRLLQIKDDASKSDSVLRIGSGHKERLATYLKSE